MIYLCKTIKPLLALTLVLLSLPCLATSSAGELEFVADTGKRHTALLLDTAISGEVNGMLANITVTQTFKNDSDRWLNGRYVFPLPPGAAVDSLTIEIGERVIEGVIKEKEDAKRTFEQAQRQGKKAGLLRQHRPNLFSIAVANIGPFEKIVSKITFIDQVDFENDTFSLSLPTTLTPRYIPNASATLSKQQQKQLEHDLRSEADVDINSSHGWAANTDRIDDTNNITPPQAHGFVSQTSHRFSLDLSLRVGLDLQHIASPSHPVSANFNSDDVQVSLANGVELMNRDLILEWQPVLGEAPKAALFQQASESEFYTMMMLTPPKTNASISLPRDVTFIVDSSGSMAGEPMRQAKQALHDGLQYLNAGDRFNIVDFDSQYRTLYSQSQEVNFDHLENAKQMIKKLAAGGGTEMIGALKFALTSKQDSNYLRQVIFITDGAISNESELFKLISQHLGDTRLFTVGIGSAPNAFFMSKAAKYGRGSYTFIRDLNQVQRRMATLFEKINKPVLRDLNIKWPTKVEQYPKYLPDLYAGQPLTVLVKSSSPIDTVDVSGSMLNTPWTKTLTIAKPDQLKSKNKSIDTVWARQKIAYLMDKLYTGEQTQEQIKPLIIALGIKHQLLTKFTAFVAVEKTPSKPEFAKAKQHAVPNIMPKGSTMSVPQTASPASVLNLLGVLMVLLSLVINRLFSRKPSTALSILSRVRSQRSAEV